MASEDSFGADALAGVKAAIKEQKLPEPTIALYKRNTVAVEDAVKTIAAANPQAVLMICTAKPCEAFVRQYRKQGGFQPMFTLSNVSSKAFIQSLGENGRGLGMTQVFPNPNNTTLPLVKEYRELVKGHPDLVDSYPALEGFVSAKILVEGLRRSGANPTREGLITAMETFKNMDFGGLTMNYSPTNRNGSDFVELTVVSRNGTVVR